MEKKSEETTSSPQDEKNTLPDQKLKEEFLEKFRRSCPVEIEKFLFCKRSKTPDNIRKECHSFALDMLMCGGRVFCNEAYYEVIKCCQSEEKIKNPDACNKAKEVLDACFREKGLPSSSKPQSQTNGNQNSNNNEKQ